jgi:Berberine and berberine like
LAAFRAISAGKGPETCQPRGFISLLAVHQFHGAAARGVPDATAALAPAAIPGGYPNILGPEDAERTRLGFGGNLNRLLAAKHRYDPDGTFTAIGALT